MNKTFVIALVGVLCWYGARSQNKLPLGVSPSAPDNGKPAPRRPLFPLRPAQPAEASSTVGGNVFNGVEVECDLPNDQHLKNKDGRDGAGLCVFTSIDMMANWHNFLTLIGFRDYMTQFPGGGYPDKVREYVKKYAESRGFPVPVEGKDYGQFYDTNPQSLAQKLDEILNTNRIACITYGYSPRYGPFKIAHMVCLVHFDLKNNLAAVLDNNFPGTLEWMTASELVNRCLANRGGWCVWLNTPTPTPVPVN